MMSLQNLVQQSYDAVLNYISDVKIVLLHPNSRYRSLVIAKLLAELPQPVYYYAMGPYDVNLSAFITGFMRQFEEQAVGFGRRLQHLNGQIDRVSQAEVLASMQQDLADLSDKPYLLVLDEFDASENANDVMEFLENLLTHLPEQCRVIINSRNLPRFPWVALLAEQQAVILEDTYLITDQLYGQSDPKEALAQLVINCLGPGQISKNGTLISDWEGHLPRLLLIFALERPVVTRSEICSAFWPNLDTDQAVNVFHVTKRRLHKALGCDALVHYNSYYQVNPALHISYDVIDFVTALLMGRYGPEEQANQAWQQAVDLYQGPFLQGHTEGWVLRQRAAYQLGYTEAMIHVARQRQVSGKPEHALRLLIQASQEYNDFEPLHHEIMKLYATLGRRSEAASHYHSIVEGLHERGLEPTPIMQALYAELMS